MCKIFEVTLFLVIFLQTEWEAIPNVDLVKCPQSVWLKNGLPVSQFVS